MRTRAAFSYHTRKATNVPRRSGERRARAHPFRCLVTELRGEGAVPSAPIVEELELLGFVSRGGGGLLAARTCEEEGACSKGPPFFSSTPYNIFLYIAMSCGAEAYTAKNLISFGVAE